MTGESPQDRHPDEIYVTPNDAIRAVLQYGFDGTTEPDNAPPGDNSATADVLFYGGQTAPMDLFRQELFDGTAGFVDGDGVFRPYGGEA